MISYTSVFTEEYISQIVTVFTILFYLFQCFLGYKFIKQLVAVAGFIVGFVVGFSVSLTTYQFPNGYIPTLIGIVVGIILAALVFKLYYLGVFVMCGAIAVSAVSRIPVTGILRAIICILIFLVAGIIAVKFAKMCIICITAISGAISAGTLMKGPFPILESNVLVFIAVIGLLAIAGILVQRVTTRKE